MISKIEAVYNTSVIKADYTSETIIRSVDVTFYQSSNEGIEINQKISLNFVTNKMLTNDELIKLVCSKINNDKAEI